MNTCRTEHGYSDRKCVLPKDHASQYHQAEDGFRWIHREEEIGPDEFGNVILETWDEPFEDA